MRYLRPFMRPTGVATAWRATQERAVNSQKVHIFERLPVSDQAHLRTRSRAVRRCSRFVVALALGAAGQTTLALGLGELTATSRLGEPLRAELSLIEGPSEQIEAACFKIAPRPAGAEDLPRLSRAMFVVDRRSHPARLRVSTTNPINEPIVVVGLAVGCGVELARDYPLLLAPPESSPVATHESKAPAAPARTTVARRPPTRAAAVAGKEWQVVEGETLRSISQALYPGSKRAQRRWINATSKANPDLFRGEARPADTAIPAGTRLRVVDWRHMPSTADADLPEARERAAPPQREPAPRPAPMAKPTATTDRLRIGEVAEVDANLPRTPGLDISHSSDLSEAQIDLLRREHQLLAKLQEQVVMQLALAEKIKKTEETLAALKASLNSADQGTSSSVAPVVRPPPAPPLAAPAAAPPMSVASKPARGTAVDKVAIPDWLSFLLLTALALALLLFLRRRSQQKEADASYEPASEEERPSAPEMDIPLTADILLPPQRPPAHRENDLLAQQRHFEEAHNIDVAEHESAVELADIMLSFGRVQGAAQTLADYIEANPKQAVRPWLKLLEVYRDANMQTEFDTLAHRLNQTFNVETMGWDTTTPQHFRSSLEGYPHIVAKLVKIWGSRECLDYLSHLVQDNRNGTRAGFPLSVLHEIMLLSSLLEHQSTAHEQRSAAAA